jgi:hypothetical protein
MLFKKSHNFLIKHIKFTMVQFSKIVTYISKNETSTSAVDIAGYGLYTAFVGTKKGPQTPVRRSCRGARKTPYRNSENSTESLPKLFQVNEKISEEEQIPSNDAFERQNIDSDASDDDDDYEIENTFLKLNLDDDAGDKIEGENEDKPKVLSTVEEDDLCATFEVQLRINKKDLKVKSCLATLVSPQPDHGRHITVKEANSNEVHIFSPVRRSSRLSS